MSLRQGSIYHVSLWKCYTKFEITTQIQKCIAVFATQKALSVLNVALQNATQTLGIATQIQKCLAVFATP